VSNSVLTVVTSIGSDEEIRCSDWRFGLVSDTCLSPNSVVALIVAPTFGDQREISGVDFQRQLGLLLAAGLDRFYSADTTDLHAVVRRLGASIHLQAGTRGQHRQRRALVEVAVRLNANQLKINAVPTAVTNADVLSGGS
jgi:hypothetical protein